MDERQVRQRAAYGFGFALLYVVAAVVIYALAPMSGERWWVAAIIGPTVAVLLIPLAFLASRRILESADPLFAIGHAVILSLTVLVLGFATTYYSLATHDPAEFEGLATKLDAVYFTVTTLSTVGFGDVSAVGQWGRGIVIAQIAADFLFVVVVVGIIRWSGKRRVDAGPTTETLRDELNRKRRQ